MSETTEKFDCWAIVELFGHQKIAGRVTEASIAGGAFIRIDVPAVGEQKAFTRFFGPSAIYSMNPTTEEIAVAAASYHMNTPVNRYELPKLAEKNEPQPPVAAPAGHIAEDEELFDRGDDDDF